MGVDALKTRPARAGVAGRGRLWRIVVLAVAASMSMAVALVTCEIAARWAFRDVTSTASGGSYFSRHAAPIRVNSLGFRDREFVVPKPPRVYRIVAIGDSLTNGGGILESERFTNLIDAQLRAEGKEVLNLGMPGNDLPQYLDVLDSTALPLDPDFILLQLFVNDFDSPEEGRPRNSSKWFPAVHRNLQLRSALYTVASIGWGNLEGALGIVETYPDYVRRTLGDASGPPWTAAARRLTKFIARCRAVHVPLGIVFFPHLAFDRHSYPFAYLNDRVERICREQGVPYLDLLPVFSVARREALQVNRFDAHPSAKANRMAAAAILAAFRPLWPVHAQARRPPAPDREHSTSVPR